ncbi:hypothetical protein, partial [Rheinheimera sp.]|uniref:hypothetical protein n=1 Tax=Rheinheimera sp. TaxID=1869214 RepID=UPI004048E40C
MSESKNLNNFLSFTYIYMYKKRPNRKSYFGTKKKRPAKKTTISKPAFRRALYSIAETKYHDFISAATAPSRESTNVGLCLSQVPQQGTVANSITREGNMLQPISLEVSAFFEVGVTDSITRMMIIKFTDGGANLTSV